MDPAGLPLRPIGVLLAGELYQRPQLSTVCTLIPLERISHFGRAVPITLPLDMGKGEALCGLEAQAHPPDGLNMRVIAYTGACGFPLPKGVGR